MGKRFKHDCEKCFYVGNAMQNALNVDVYICVTSVVARFGDDPPAYNSIPRQMVKGTNQWLQCIAVALEEGVPSR